MQSGGQTNMPSLEPCCEYNLSKYTAFCINSSASMNPFRKSHSHSSRMNHGLLPSLHQKQPPICMFFLLLYSSKVLLHTYQSNIFAHLQLVFFATSCDHTLHNLSTERNQLKRLPTAKFGYKLIAKAIYAELACIIHMPHLIFVIQILFYANWNGIRETAGKKSAFLLTESYGLFQSEGTAEKTEKENIVENVTYSHPIYSREFTEDVHSPFFTRKCEQRLSLSLWLSHGGQATMLTETPRKEEYRSVVLCIVSAITVIIV